jgi:Homeodomain-like domain
VTDERIVRDHTGRILLGADLEPLVGEILFINDNRVELGFDVLFYLDTVQEYVDSRKAYWDAIHRYFAGKGASEDDFAWRQRHTEEERERIMRLFKSPTTPPTEGMAANAEDRRKKATQLYSEGYTQVQIAQRFHVNDRTVRRWLNGK